MTLANYWLPDPRDLTLSPSPRLQRCDRCGLVYRRVRFERTEPDACPMCRLTDERQAERERAS